MSRYSKQTLQRLRNRIDITQLIKALDIPWKTSDGYLRFLCPLCSEFLTACHPKTNLARCFLCEQNFNPIDTKIKKSNSTICVAEPKFSLTICSHKATVEPWLKFARLKSSLNGLIA